MAGMKLGCSREKRVVCVGFLEGDAIARLIDALLRIARFNTGLDQQRLLIRSGDIRL
jgi:hypothetical protein